MNILMLRQSLRRVFRDYRYRVVAMAAAALTFALSIWLRNLNLIVITFRSSLFDIGDSLWLMLWLLGGIVTDATVLAAGLIIATSLLFGVNTAMVIYYFAQRRSLPKVKESTTIIGGLVSAVFGVGCASCGTFVLGALLSSVGASGLLALLPLGGHEFLILSVALLFGSIYWMAKSIQTSQVCVSVELKVVTVN